jgi:hypothetical protein
MRRAAAHRKPKIQTPRIISKDLSAIIDKGSSVFDKNLWNGSTSAKLAAL